MAKNYDVVFGEEGGQNPGNKSWAVLVRQHVEEYNEANSRDNQRSVAGSVIFALHQNGGRFLVWNDDAGRFVEDEDTLHSTMQCFVNLNHRL